MNTQDKLDRILRRDAASEEIADAGFSYRVMGALPARVPRRRPGLDPLLVLGSAAAGSVLAAVFAPADTNVVQGAIDLFHRHALTPAAYACMGLSAVLFVSAILLAKDN
jgi:hypothetical protein